MNITVRTEGVINNTLTAEQFIEIAAQIFGEDKTLEEYIELYNAAPEAKKKRIAVHKEQDEGNYV